MTDGTITASMANKYAALLAERDKYRAKSGWWEAQAGELQSTLSELKAENERLDAGWQKLHGLAEKVMLEDKTTIARLEADLSYAAYKLHDHDDEGPLYEGWQSQELVEFVDKYKDADNGRS